MKLKYVQIIFLLCSFVLRASGVVCAETPFLDPHIPSGETATYISQIGDKLLTVVERVVIKREGERELYVITSRSEHLDRTIRLVKDTMATLSVHTVRKFPEVTLDSHLTVIDEKLHFGKDEIKLADFAIMTYIFRGFPFGTLKKLKIGYYGEERQKEYAFSVQYKNREKVEVNQQTIECHKIEFGMDGFWGTFFPKMKVWYSVDPPHYLVRYEGLAGPPGSPKRNMELVTYTVMETSS